MKTRALAIVLAICMVISMLPAAAFAAQPQPAVKTAPTELDKPAGSPPDVSTQASHKVSLTGGSHGYTELLVSASAPAGSEVYFLADPDDGYMAEVFITGTETGLVSYVGLNIWGFIMPSNNVSVEVRYVATQGRSHKVQLVAGAGGKSTLYSTTATESESVFLTVLPDDQKLFRPDQDVVASYGTLHYLYMDEETGEHWYELYMPDENVTLTVSHRGSVPLRVNATVSGGKDSCTVKIEPENPRFRDPVTVTIEPAGGYNIDYVQPAYQNGRPTVDLSGYGNVYTFTMPPYDVDLEIAMKRYAYSASATVENGIGGAIRFDGSSLTHHSADYISPGKTVSLICEPSEGYRVARITGVKNLVDKGNNQYSFTMPEAAVDIRVLFLRNENPFLDVNETHFFYTPVLWAAEEGITSGISATEFGPNQACNRAQVVTFLWRYAGSPEPTTTTCPFTDVQKGSWYEKPVLWAVENGITNGVSATEFAPNQTCNRAQVVTFLWRFLRQPAPGLTEHPFTDVEAGSWYEQPVLWAVENGITNGATATTFDPDGKCQRAQVVTFLYRTGHGKEPSPVPPVGKLTIHTAVDTVVYLGETLQIDYTYTSDKSALTFTSNDTSILTVDNNGMVTGVGTGTTRVYVYYGDTRLGHLRLIVEEKPAPTGPDPVAKSISCSSFTGPYFEGTSGVVGNYMTFTAVSKTTDADTNQNVTAASSNPDVASIELVSVGSSNFCRFKVSFVGAGTATITITSEDGNVSTSYTVTVRDSYDTPIGRRLTPEQFVECVNGILVENGATIDTTMGYLVEHFSDDELTGSSARDLAEGWCRHWWPNGKRYMGLAYQGTDENGNHIFYFHR